MNWEIIVHDDEGFIEFITSGHADRDGSLDMARVITENMRKHNITRALIDHTKISDVTGDAVEIYDRPKILKRIGEIYKIKIAEIIKEEHGNHFRFFETVCKNQGILFSIFHEREKAIPWLLK